jgi:hypothetical protein
LLQESIITSTSVKLTFYSVCSDNVPAVLIKSWPLASTMWDGDVLAGPVPTLFAEDVEASREAFLDNMAKAHNDLGKLYRAFFMPEHILVDEAADLLRKPRAGAALYSFKRGKFTPPEVITVSSPKRARVESTEDTGV